MINFLVLFLIVTAASLIANDTDETSLSATMALCTTPWERNIEDSLPTSDGRGHGPDVGSDEWKSVVEFKLGIRDEPGLPERESLAWCDYVDKLVRDRREMLPENKKGPSFACKNIESGSIEAIVCGDEELSALDRQLSDTYTVASTKASDEHASYLKAEQRGWIRGRRDCWKSDDSRGCVRDAYKIRIAELQAKYRLAPFIGPVTFLCGGILANEVVVMFFETEPRTLIAKRGESVSLMYIQPSASGSKYQGANETFWEHHGEAVISWGYNAGDSRCKKVTAN